MRGASRVRPPPSPHLVCRRASVPGRLCRLGNCDCREDSPGKEAAGPGRAVSPSPGARTESGPRLSPVPMGVPRSSRAQGRRGPATGDKDESHLNECGPEADEGR